MKKNTNVIEVISFLLISILQYNNAKCASCLVTKKKKKKLSIRNNVKHQRFLYQSIRQ
jgi:hypothetical protein